MKPKEILVFGASGQIGRNLIRKLTKNNYKVVAVTRNIHQKGYILKTQANPGYLDIVELNYFNLEKIENLIEECSICINLIGILFEKKKNFFKKIHTDFPDLLSKLSAKKNIEKLIHLSSLGIEESKDSKYAISKLEGENKVKKNFERSVILKPSIVYSVDDNFTTNFMTLLNLLPFMPLYYEGKTKFAPIHVADLVSIIFVGLWRVSETNQLPLPASVGVTPEPTILSPTRSPVTPSSLREFWARTERTRTGCPMGVNFNRSPATTNPEITVPVITTPDPLI